MAEQYGDGGEPITLDNDTGEIVTGAVGLQAITSAEINQAVLTAKQFPRRRDQVIINEIMGRATLTEEIAEKCNYLLPRGGKKIPGPSIRFAEIVRAAYWNIRVASRFVALDTADMERAAVLVEAVALDVETNQSEIIPVRRSIMTSGRENRRPQIYNADMINQTVQAAVSIARRNAILTVVPQALWSAGYQRVVEVLKGSIDTLADRRVKMIEALVKVGVEPKQLFEFLGVTDETDIKLDHMPTGRALLTAIREGEPVESALGRLSVTEQPKHTPVKSPLKDDPITSGPQAGRGAEPAIDANDDGQRNRLEPGSEEAGSAAEEEAAGSAAAEQGTKTPPAGENAPAASSGPANGQSEAKKGEERPYTDGKSYLEWLRDRIDAAGSKAAVTDVWGSTRDYRAENCSNDEIGMATTWKEAKLKKLKEASK